MALCFKEWGKVAQVFGLQPSSPQGRFPYQALCQDATYNHRELLTTGLYLNIWNGKRHLLRESSSTCLGLQAQGEESELVRQCEDREGLPGGPRQSAKWKAESPLLPTDEFDWWFSVVFNSQATTAHEKVDSENPSLTERFW